jgi:hypothetical protein
MSRPTTELTHLFRQLKAPAAAAALPKLADRARAEEWSYEQFAAVLLKTETDSRDSHGGQPGSRPRGSRRARRWRSSTSPFRPRSRAPPFCTSVSSTSSLAARTSSCSGPPILVHTALLAAVIG